MEMEGSTKVSTLNVEGTSVPLEEENDTSEKQFTCEECDEKFFFQHSFMKHMRKIHFVSKPQHVCADCGKTFTVIHNLRRHMLTHTGEKPHVCPLCQQTFSQDIHLTRHLRRHFDDKPFQCPTCNKNFIDDGVLKIHMRIHSGEKPYACTICEKKFTQKFTLDKHMKTHSGPVNVFKCTYCEKEFTCNSHLFSHMRVHNTEKKFECPYCLKKFSSFSGHYKHMKLHERDGNYGVLQRRPAVLTAEKKFDCSLCDKKFQTFSGHYKHMKTHTSEGSDHVIRDEIEDIHESTSDAAFHRKEEDRLSDCEEDSGNDPQNRILYASDSDSNVRETNEVYVKEELEESKGAQLLNDKGRDNSDHEMYITKEEFVCADSNDGENFEEDSDKLLIVKKEREWGYPV